MENIFFSDEAESIHNENNNSIQNENNNKSSAENVAVPLGNTISKGTATFFKARAFNITLNQVDRYNELKLFFLKYKNITYWLAVKETGELTEHEHIHIYAHFSKTQKILLKNCCGAHVEKCKGSPKQNIAYLKKINSQILDEIGEPPSQGKLTIGYIKSISETERDDLPAMFYNVVSKVNALQRNDLKINEIAKKIEVYYIWGESGVGKTTLALKLIDQFLKKNNYNTFNTLKREGGFWLGIGNSKAALYDDFRDSHMKPSEFINFIDYNKHNLNIKNSKALNEYEFIVITSVQNPKEIYKLVQEKDQEPRKQWLRRLKIINLINKDDINSYLINN